MEIKEFHNAMIAFDTEKEMINATDVMKIFPSKRMNNFLRQKQTKDFIKQLEKSDARISATVVKTGGSTQGTWMHRILALKFAAWLSPEFDLFVFQTFDELIKEKLKTQQMQLDYFWDKEDQKDLYKRK